LLLLGRPVLASHQPTKFAPKLRVRPILNPVDSPKVATVNIPATAARIAAQSIYLPAFPSPW
jgi:hypothetical protein